MSLEYPPQLRKAMLHRRRHPLQQFGQANDYYTFGGATGCTQTVLQTLAYLWLKKLYTQDEISKLSGYPLPGRNPNRRGMRPAEVAEFCRKVGLPYVVKYGLTALEVAHYSKQGPVGFGHIYGWWPEWKGRRGADGHPNGYATPSGKAGRTQFDWSGRHFGLHLGYAYSPDEPDLHYAWEPNHGSAARPEKPPYDRMSYAQFVKVYDSYHDHGGMTPYALVPLKTLPAKGY